MEEPLWDEVCGYLDLGPLLGRRVHNLSGGEQQRVALGRALLAAPELLLLDEPLASLDNDSKEEIIPYLRTVISKLGIPAVYISHSREELRTLVDRFLTVRDGRIVGGPAGEVDAGQRQLLSARVERMLGEGLVLCLVDGREVLARIDGAADDGASVVLAFLDSDVAVSRGDGPTHFNVGSLPARIDRVESGRFGWEALAKLTTKGGAVMTRLNLRPEELDGLSRGQQVELSFLRMPQVLIRASRLVSKAMAECAVRALPIRFRQLPSWS